MCAQRGGRSRLTTLQFDGVARASRPLPDANGAVRVVTATLGPGMLGGDRLTRDVDVGAGATLVLASQMATPIFAGDSVSRSATAARIGVRAALYAPGEPLLVAPSAVHETSTSLAVRGDGLAFAADIIVLGDRARVGIRTTGTIDGRLVVRDACDLAGDGTGRALLSVVAVSADAELRASLHAAFDALLATDSASHGGVGSTGGAVVLRAVAPGAWALQTLLERLVTATRDAAEVAVPAA